MAARIITAFALFLVGATPAFSAQTCVIVVAADRASTTEIYRHELAHCNGWSHPDKNHKAKPVKGYQAPKPPESFIRPYAGKLVDHWVTSKEALRLCGSYGCQWFD